MQVAEELIYTEEEPIYTEQEETENILMQDVHQAAQSLNAALKMERERLEYFESLYDFSYGVSNLTEEPVYLGSTESKALYIIDQKQAYEMRIGKLKERYSRFKGLVRGLPNNDKRMITNYFEHGHKVDYDELRACINRVSKYMEEAEEAREKALDHEAAQKYAVERKMQRIEKSRASIKENEGKKQYLINGRFEYMTDKEYQLYQQQEPFGIPSRGLWANER